MFPLSVISDQNMTVASKSGTVPTKIGVHPCLLAKILNSPKLSPYPAKIFHFPPFAVLF